MRCIMISSQHNAIPCMTEYLGINLIRMLNDINRDLVNIWRAPHIIYLRGNMPKHKKCVGNYVRTNSA